MSRLAALCVAASLLILPCALAAGEESPPASPFETIPEARTPQQSHLGAYLTLAAGAALVGVSFGIQNRADRTYDQYLSETDPAQIEELYERTLFYDRWGRVALVGGEALVATGLYLRFLRRPSPPRAMLELSPQRCALALRF